MNIFYLTFNGSITRLFTVNHVGCFIYSFFLSFNFCLQPLRQRRLVLERRFKFIKIKFFSWILTMPLAIRYSLITSVIFFYCTLILGGWGGDLHTQEKIKMSKERICCCLCFLLFLWLKIVQFALITWVPTKYLKLSGEREGYVCSVLSESIMFSMESAQYNLDSLIHWRH